MMVARPAGPHHVRVSYRREANFLERVGSSFVGSLIGVGVVIGACVLLFWNEGRSVYTYDVLVEARSRCNPLRNSDNKFDTLNNKLIYLNGHVTTDTPLEDTNYGVSSYAARLKRRVEMYQWEELRETREYKEPDGTIRTETYYSYNQEWREHVIDSRPFDDVRHENPKTMLVEPREFTANPVRVGVYTLADDALSMVTNWQRINLAPSTNAGAQLYDNKLYHGNPHYPQIGDVRIWYEVAGRSELGQEDMISVVAMQAPGGRLTAFPSHIHHGYTILYVYMETLSMDEVFTKEHSSNTALTWLLRGVGLLLVAIGFNLIMRIIVTLFDWIPLVHELVAVSTFLLSLLLSVSLSLVVMAVAWIRYRPIYALAVLLGACIPFTLTKLFARKEQTQ